MTRKKALNILIQAASNDVAGAGKGYRSTTDEWRREVSEAIKKVFKEAKGRELDSSDTFNLHLTFY